MRFFLTLEEHQLKRDGPRYVGVFSACSSLRMGELKGAQEVISALDCTDMSSLNTSPGAEYAGSPTLPELH